MKTKLIENECNDLEKYSIIYGHRFNGLNKKLKKHYHNCKQRNNCKLLKIIDNFLEIFKNTNNYLKEINSIRIFDKEIIVNYEYEFRAFTLISFQLYEYLKRNFPLLDRDYVRTNEVWRYTKNHFQMKIKIGKIYLPTSSCKWPLNVSIESKDFFSLNDENVNSKLFILFERFLTIRPTLRISFQIERNVVFTVWKNARFNLGVLEYEANDRKLNKLNDHQKKFDNIVKKFEKEFKFKFRTNVRHIKLENVFNGLNLNEFLYKRKEKIHFSPVLTWSSFEERKIDETNSSCLKAYKWDGVRYCMVVEADGSITILNDNDIIYLRLPLSADLLRDKAFQVEYISDCKHFIIVDYLNFHLDIIERINWLMLNEETIVSYLNLNDEYSFSIQKWKKLNTDLAKTDLPTDGYLLLTDNVKTKRFLLYKQKYRNTLDLKFIGSKLSKEEIENGNNWSLLHGHVPFFGKKITFINNQNERVVSLNEGKENNMICEFSLKSPITFERTRDDKCIPNSENEYLDVKI